MWRQFLPPAVHDHETKPTRWWFARRRCASSSGIEAHHGPLGHRFDRRHRKQEAIVGFADRLRNAVTVLSAADPVRVFQEFATVDLLSGGRVELVVGRGSFTEAFPLFGLDLADYDELFDEKLDLLLRLRENTEVTWSGRHRPPLVRQRVYPRPVQDPLPVWVGVGGTPASFVRAGLLGLPLMVAIIGGGSRQTGAASPSALMRRPSSTPGCRTGWATPVTTPPSCSCCSARRASTPT